MTQALPSAGRLRTVRRTASSYAGPLLAATGLSLAAATLVLVVALPLSGETPLSRLAVGAFVAGTTGLTVVGAVLVHRRPDHPMGWALVVTGFAAVASRLVAGWAGAALAYGLPLPAVVLWATNWAWVPGQAAALLVLLRFPDGRLPKGLGWRVAEGAVLAWGAVTLLVTALLPGPLGQQNLDHLDNPLGVAALAAPLDALLPVLFPVGTLLPLLALGALGARWLRGGDEVRQQLRWVAAAAALLAATAPFAVLGGVPELALALAFLLLPAAISVAVLRHRLWDLGLVVRRSLVYAASVAVLAGGYVAAVVLIEARATPLVAGLGIAVLAVPVRQGAERLLERWLYGDRGDPEMVARSLAHRLADSDESVVQAVVDQLARSLRLPHVAITDPDGSVLAASCPAPPAGHREAARVPLRFRGDQVGWLRAHERAAGEGLGPRDRALLERVAQPAGLAVRMLRLDRALHASHDRTLAARDEERARLQRDLHDGIGPTLGGVTLRAEAARNLLGRGAPPSEVDRVLAQIGETTETAMAEVRRLVEDLRPTALEQHGLRRGLEEAVGLVREDLTVRLLLPDPLPPLPARVELAAYRIAVEGLRNAQRHARARTAEVRLSVADGALTAEVTDDGVGVGDAPAGVGRRSMADRARALGGTLELTDTGRGTRLRVVLPLEAT